MTLRFHLPPGGDVPPVTAARRLGLSLEEFNKLLPVLLQTRFPAADPITGNYDLDAIDVWRRGRHPNLYPRPLTPRPATNANTVMAERLEKMRGSNGIR